MTLGGGVNGSFRVQVVLEKDKGCNEGVMAENCKGDEIPFSVEVVQ